MEREEGELSDEEYEDVSDNSCISASPLVISGKSSPLSAGREPFRELSLTSISEESVESDFIPTQRTPKYRLLSKQLKELPKRNGYHRHCEHYKGNRKYISRRTKKYSPQSFTRDHSDNSQKYINILSETSDSDNCIPDKKIWKQLRDAVRINSSKKSSNCSLRTRLKHMIEPDCDDSKNSNSDDNELEALRDQALQSKQKSENQQDPADTSTNTSDKDLTDLRLAALHSAIVKKHQNRRKKRDQQQNLLQETTDSKANNIDVENEIESLPEILPEIKSTENNFAPDICSKNDKECNKLVSASVNDAKRDTEDEDEDILRAMVLTSICKKISDKKLSNTCENDKFTNKVKVPSQKNNPQPSAIHVNRFVINVNSDSESDEQMLIEKHKANNAVQNNDLFDKSLSQFLKQARAKSEINDSDIAKHLPHPQQLEYKRLKRKLQQLSTIKKAVPKVRKSVDILNENKRIRLMNTTAKHTVPKITSTSNGMVTHAPILKPTSNVLVKNAVYVSDRHFNKVSRLQMKGKYEELGPLMARVSEAHKARDQTQAEVKRLINNLRDARAQLTTTHQTYTILIQQLVKAKTNIDKRLDDQQKSRIKKMTNMCTSTPNKLAQKEISCELSCINETITPEQEMQVDVSQINEDLIENCEIKPDSATVRLEKELPCEPAIEEINDLKYSSPLDHMQLNSEESTSNPLMVLCPYDLLGVCRDADCQYRHCGTPATD